MGLIVSEGRWGQGEDWGAPSPLAGAVSGPRGAVWSGRVLLQLLLLVVALCDRQQVEQQFSLAPQALPPQGPLLVDVVPVNEVLVGRSLPLPPPPQPLDAPPDAPPALLLPPLLLDVLLVPPPDAPPPQLDDPPALLGPLPLPPLALGPPLLLLVVVRLQRLVPESTQPSPSPSGS